MNNTSTFKHPILAWLLVLPQLLVTIVFFFWPAFAALRQSVYRGDAFGLHTHFVLLQNFIDLFHDSSYLESVGVTLLFSLLVTVLTMACGLLMAFLVNRVIVGQGLYKSLLIWPYAVAPAVAGILWRFLFNPAIGWGPYLLAKLGIDWNYMLNSKQALCVVVFAASWQQFSYNFLFFFAGLQAIPKSLLEAAKIDGASDWQSFWHIIFPLLAPMTFFLLVINMIYAFFDTFGIVQIVTNGGPASATSILVYKVYNDGFLGLDMGSSAAQSVILMAFVIGLTTVQFRYLEKKVHY